MPVGRRLGRIAAMMDEKARARQDIIARRWSLVDARSERTRSTSVRESKGGFTVGPAALGTFRRRSGAPSPGLPDLDPTRKVSLAMLVHRVGTEVRCVEEPYL